MPLYEYECEACGKRFEIIQRFSDPPPDACRLCGNGPVRRRLSSPAIQFKGSGFYITDYTKKSGVDSSAEPSKSDESTGGKKEPGQAAAGKSDAGAAKSEGAKSESGSAPAKSETPAKADSKPAPSGSTKSSSGGD